MSFKKLQEKYRKFRAETGDVAAEIDDYITALETRAQKMNSHLVEIRAMVGHMEPEEFDAEDLLCILEVALKGRNYDR